MRRMGLSYQRELYVCIANNLGIVYEFPRGDWAVFDCIGPIPESLQSLNTRIFKEWLPGNPDYELCGNANVEWYDCINGEKTDKDYHSAIWIPVKKKV